jgi:hypothetical protein
MTDRLMSAIIVAVELPRCVMVMSMVDATT